jgi:hypothetical protein
VAIVDPDDLSSLRSEGTIAASHHDNATVGKTASQMQGRSPSAVTAKIAHARILLLLLQGGHERVRVGPVQRQTRK